MRGFASLCAVTAVVSSASGAIVPPHFMRASSSHVAPSPAVHATPSYNDFGFDWALASSIAGLTGPPVITTAHQFLSSTPLSTTASTLSTVTKSALPPADGSLGSSFLSSSATHKTRSLFPSASSTRLTKTHTLLTNPTSPYVQTDFVNICTIANNNHQSDSPEHSLTRD